MITLSINGSAAAPVIGGQLILPEQGRGIAAVEAGWDGPVPKLYDRVVLDDSEGNVFRFGVLAATVVRGRLTTTIGLGTGRLGVAIPTRHYRQMDARQVVSDLCSDSGETLSKSTGKGMRLIHWTRRAGPGGPSLEALVANVGWIWRTLPDGTVWAGPRRFDLANTDALVIDQSATSRTVALRPTRLDVMPATSLLVDGVDRNILRVEYNFGANFSAKVWY